MRQLIFAMVAVMSAVCQVAGQKCEIAAQSTAMSEETIALNRKGLQLLRVCSQEMKGENALLSPFSVDSAFSLLWLGSSGETRDEVAAVLGLPGTADFLSRANRRLSASREPEILTSNSLWVDRRMPLATSYSDLVDRYFSRTVFAFDNTDGDGTANRVNAYVSEKTKGLIPSVLTRDDIRPYKNDDDRGTGLILLNTLYFKGMWQDEFNKENTERDVDFNWLDGRAGRVEMMRDTRTAGYAEGADYQVLSLPYKFDCGKNDPVACDFVAVLPTPALDGEKLLDRLSEGDAFGNLLASITNRTVHVWLPKLDVKSLVSLKRGLHELGMTRAFESHPDSYPAITEGRGGVYVDRVDDVIHAVHIKMDEEKTEAAAATVIAVCAVAGCVCRKPPEPPIPIFRADHPYLGFIVNRETGLILFAGIFRALGKDDLHATIDAVALETREARRRAEFVAAQRQYEKELRHSRSWRASARENASGR